MSQTPQMIPPGEALVLRTLVTPTEQGIASRVLAKTGGGNLTLFAFDAGQGLTEHTSPFEALVMVLEGVLNLTIGGTPKPYTMTMRRYDLKGGSGGGRMMSRWIVQSITPKA